jgi:hypothetical protein
LLAAALLFLVSPHSAWAQDEAELPGVGENDYESPTWGYRLAWDGDRWEAVQSTSDEAVDILFLQSRRSSLVLQSGPFAGDPKECVSAVAGALSSEEGVDDWEPLEDDAGDPVAGETGGRAWAAFTLTFTADDGSEFADVDYVECRTLVEGEAVLLILHNTSQDDFPDEAAKVESILETIELPDDQEQGTNSEPGNEEGSDRHRWEVAGATDAPAEDNGREPATDDCDEFGVWLVETADRAGRADRIVEEIGRLGAELEPEDFVAAMKGFAAEFSDMADAQGNSDPPAGGVDVNVELATTFANYSTVVGEIADMLEFSQVVLTEGVEIDNSLLAEAWALLPSLTDQLGLIVDDLQSIAGVCEIEL